MTIEYYRKSIYGRWLLYPLNKSVKVLTGKKTMRNVDMLALEALGHTFKEVFPNRGKEMITNVYRK